VARFKRRKEKSESKAKSGGGGKSSSKSHSNSGGADPGSAVAGYEYYDNGGEGASGAYMVASGDYMCYTTSGAGESDAYITSDGIPVTSAAGYGAYTYDTSGAGETYDPNVEGGYQQQQGYGKFGRKKKEKRRKKVQK
jgi:hypothetical protein